MPRSPQEMGEPITRTLPAKNLGGGERNTHRVSLGSPAEIDEEVIGWMWTAYELDGRAAKRGG